jgi:hypothetical protein
MVDGEEGARHWDLAYETGGPTGLSWYEPAPRVSLELIHEMELGVDARVIDVGGGESTLVDHLLAAGFRDLTVLDVSVVALTKGRQRVDDARVNWLLADVTAWRSKRTYGLWHDRAVFHFLVSSADQSAYLGALRSATEPGSVVIIGTFAPHGPESCSGLPVARYSADELALVLGERFEIMRSFEAKHATPAGGVQPFTWVAGKMT